jgi:hypothetical protein
MLRKQHAQHTLTQTVIHTLLSTLKPRQDNSPEIIDGKRTSEYFQRENEAEITEGNQHSNQRKTQRENATEITDQQSNQRKNPKGNQQSTDCGWMIDYPIDCVNGWSIQSIIPDGT